MYTFMSRWRRSGSTTDDTNTDQANRKKTLQRAFAEVYAAQIDAVLSIDVIDEIQLHGIDIKMSLLSLRPLTMTDRSSVRSTNGLPADQRARGFMSSIAIDDRQNARARARQRGNKAAR